MKHARKNLSLLLCLSLLSALLLVCSGCGSKDKDALVGEWETTLDLTDMLNEQVKAGLDQDMVEYIHIDSFEIPIDLTFNKDDTYEMSVNEASMEKNIDLLLDGLKDDLTKYFEDMIAAEGLDVTVDEMLGTIGYTMDQLMEESFDKDDLMSSMNEMESSGTYKVGKGTLILTDDEGPGTESYKLEGDKLTLTGEGADEDLEDMYPMVFTRK